jgi:hypothetical protein
MRRSPTLPLAWSGGLTAAQLETGQIRLGQKLLLMPTRAPVEVAGLEIDDVEVDKASCGDNLRIKLKNLEEDDVHPGFVLCDPAAACSVAREFDVTMSILELKSILTAGYQAIMHLHSLVVEASIEVCHLSLSLCLSLRLWERVAERRAGAVRGGGQEDAGGAAEEAQVCAPRPDHQMPHEPAGPRLHGDVQGLPAHGPRAAA